VTGSRAGAIAAVAQVLLDEWLTPSPEFATITEFGEYNARKILECVRRQIERLPSTLTMLDGDLTVVYRAGDLATLFADLTGDPDAE